LSAASLPPQIEELEEVDGDDDGAEAALGRFTDLATRLLQVPGVGAWVDAPDGAAPSTLVHIIEHLVKCVLHVH
jgi:hypothetical protein